MAVTYHDNPSSCTNESFVGTKAECVVWPLRAQGFAWGVWKEHPYGVICTQGIHLTADTYDEAYAEYIVRLVEAALR